jgi:predicted GIY-YIG superfamily endonuclease
MHIKDIYKIFMDYGIFLGETIFEGAAGFETIETDLFDRVTENGQEIWDSAYKREAILRFATTTIPFDSSARIYFLLQGTKIVYIGQTEGIAQRIGAHCNDKQFNCVATFTVEAEHLDRVERVNIFRYRPKYNKELIGSEWLLKEALKRA